MYPAPEEVLSPLGQALEIGGKNYTIPVFSDYVPPEDFKCISSMLWFDQLVVLVDAKEEFGSSAH